MAITKLDYLEEKMSISIVMSTIDGREELLERSLWCYTKQTYQPLEVIVVADRPKTDATKKVVESYGMKYFEIGGPPGWRNGYGQNKGIYESTGDIVCATHPECMMEFNAVQAIVDRLKNEDDVCVELIWFWMGSHTNDWLREHNEWRENIGFLQQVVTQPDYGWEPRLGNLHDWAMRTLKTAEVAPDQSDTFWQSMTMTRKTWLRIGGFTLMNTWGSTDPDIQTRKRILGIPTRIVRALSYHQWHPAGPVHNEFQKFAYNKPEDAIRELKWE